MRISKDYKADEGRFGDDIKIGEAFYYGNERLFMKIPYVAQDVTGFHDIEEYNAVDLRDGSLDFIADNALVTIADVHIEKD